VGKKAVEGMKTFGGKGVKAINLQRQKYLGREGHGVFLNEWGLKLKGWGLLREVINQERNNQRLNHILSVPAYNRHCI